MLRIKRILFPTDFSACAERAFSHAVYLADQHEADLHVLHVIQTQRNDADSLLDGLEITEGEIAEQLHVATGEPSEQQGPGGVRVVRAQRHGTSPASAILDYAEEHDSDLIVMGTHGRRGIDRLLSGSVAEEVVRRSACPVFTVCTSREEAPRTTIRRILVPVDFSEHSEAALSYARELAGTYGAQLGLLHVIEEEVLSVVYGIEPVAPAATEMMARAEQALKDMASSEGGADQVAADVKVGHAAAEVLAYANAHGADLIVISTHGRTGVKHLLLGSVAEKIVRIAPCPVFTFKSVGKDLLPEPRASARQEAEGSAAGS